MEDKIEAEPNGGTSGTFDFEAKKLEIEAKRLRIEEQKLAIERGKAKWTAASIVIPLLAAMATVAYGFWSTKEQAELNFRLEAAKSIMQAPNPVDAVGRVRFLTATFPDRLPSNFFTSVDNPYRFGTYPSSVLFDFIKLLSPRLNPSQTLELWNIVFDDGWAKNPRLIDFVAKVSVGDTAAKADREKVDQK